MRRPGNEEVAAALERVAELLEVQGASPFRVRAYARAARMLRDEPRPVAEIVRREGREGLEALPGIGATLAAQIHGLVRTGRLGFLDRLEGEVAPEDLFVTIPGVGEALAARIHRELGVETLEQLEIAAHDGRLEKVPGVGPRRAQAIRDHLAVHLRALGSGAAPSAPRSGASPVRPRVPVARLLEVDRRYRKEAEAGRLRRIAPRRFNPEGRAWLPVLHDERGGWSFTALYSNTARAHELGKTHDWVVIYAERNGDEERATVVTETRGPLRGRRVVRGRERECGRHYGVSEGGEATAQGA